MNISKLKQRLRRINLINFQFNSVLAGSIISLCLIGNASYAASTPPEFPKFSPLGIVAKAVPSTKVLFKVKSVPKVSVGASRGDIQPIGVDALGKKFKAKVTPLLKKDDPKKDKLNPRLSKVYVAEFPAGTNMEEALKTIKADSTVEYAEINGMMQAIETPNDPFFGDQWALHNIGQTGGKPDADIDASEGWEISTGEPKIVLAAVDTGVDWNHEDLIGKVILGWDFAYDDPYPDDVYGHGTHVSGIAAANTNNAIGMAGVCWGCQILAVKVLDDDGYGWWDDIAEGISYATWNGAHVINLSLGGWDDSETLHQAVIDAYEAGVTVVAAAGNEWGGPVLYPAKYPETIAVSATNHYDQLAWFSSIGPEVDVAAPGEDILSILPGNSYAWWSGTSMAAPHVTGAIGLLLSLLDPTPAEIRDCIMDSADDLGDPGLDPYFGAGRLNLAAFLAECGGPPPVPVRKCLGEICTNPDDGKQPIQGTAGDDVICGTDGDDIILAKGGNDLICCGGGNDIVDAGDGNDKVDCGPGDDVIKGGSGKDVLIGNAGDDIILGSTQDDVLEGGPGKDHLYGGDGNDVLFGRDGDDQLCGLPGKDYLNAGVGANQCDKTGNGCPPVLTPCPIINALEISSSSLTPALTNSLNVMNGLGISLDVNQ